jgi:two-component system sensor histidine kinase UhpB
MSLRPHSLHARVGLILTAAIALALGIAATLWLAATRQAIGEEVTAARRVGEQWLQVVIARLPDDDAAAIETLLPQLAAVGRLRANSLTVRDAAGAIRYRSPASPWKPGRAAPAWFSALIEPAVEARRFAVAGWRIDLEPDTSRSALDAWDTLRTASGWALALLLLVWLGTRFALRRAFGPLAQIDAALQRGAEGSFDQRLPGYSERELDHIARSFNRLAETLDESRVRNRQLEQEQHLAQTVQARLEEERRTIAAELHDELGQAITAVRAITGAIRQRTEEQPDLLRDTHEQLLRDTQELLRHELLLRDTHAILAMTRQMQDGVDAILRRLRDPGGTACEHLEWMIEDYCAQWAQRHPGIVVDCAAAAPGRIDDALALAIFRVLQESLTNVARHAAARRVTVRLTLAGGMVELGVQDDGHGIAAPVGPERFGLIGMRERVARHRGALHIEPAPGGGPRVCARLPIAGETMEVPDDAAT